MMADIKGDLLKP